MRELYANLSLIAEPYAKVGGIETIPLKPTPIWDEVGYPGRGGGAERLNPLFHHHGLGKMAWAVNIAPAQNGDVIGQ